MCDLNVFCVYASLATHFSFAYGQTNLISQFLRCDFNIHLCQNPNWIFHKVYRSMTVYLFIFSAKFTFAATLTVIHVNSKQKERDANREIAVRVQHPWLNEWKSETKLKQPTSNRLKCLHLLTVEQRTETSESVWKLAFDWNGKSNFVLRLFPFYRQMPWKRNMFWPNV